MDPIDSCHILRPEYSFAQYARSRDDSPGAPTVYMPSPVSRNVGAPNYPPASKMVRNASSFESGLRREITAASNKSGTLASLSTRRPHICLVYASRTLGVLAGLLTCVVGISRLYQQSVMLRWPETGRFFSDATNASSWRQQLFTLQPDILLDLWTPLLFGIASLLAHLLWFEVCSMTKTYWRCSAWNVLQALWANFGYCGGLGILVGTVSLTAASVNALSGCLDLHAKADISSSAGQGNLVRHADV